MQVWDGGGKEENERGRGITHPSVTSSLFCLISSHYSTNNLMSLFLVQKLYFLFPASVSSSLPLPSLPIQNRRPDLAVVGCRERPTLALQINFSVIKNSPLCSLVWPADWQKGNFQATFKQTFQRSTEKKKTYMGQHRVDGAPSHKQTHSWCTLATFLRPRPAVRSADRAV